MAILRLNCPSCSAPLPQGFAQRLTCDYCGTTSQLPAVSASSGGESVVALAEGTESRVVALERQLEIRTLAGAVRREIRYPEIRRVNMSPLGSQWMFYLFLHDGNSHAIQFGQESQQSFQAVRDVVSKAIGQR